MRTWTVATALLAGLALASCSADADPGADPTTSSVPTASPSESSDPAPEPSLPARLQGEWRLEQTRADVVRHLRQHGFGDLVERFLRVENVTEQDNWRWTFQGTGFVATWQNPDGSWRVADQGDVQVDGRRLRLVYGNSSGVTTFAWRVQGDRLWLTWQDYEGEVWKGIPDEAFWRAYLTKPLTRVA
jgi:hypothetical protein